MRIAGFRLYDLGATFLKQGMPDNAIEQFRKALNLGATLPEVHHNLGAAYLAKGLRTEAEAEFEKALALKPDFMPAQKALQGIKQHKNKNSQ